MHTFAIISNSPDLRLTRRKEILKDFQITKFEQIIIDKETKTIEAVKEAQRLLHLHTFGKNQALIIESIENLSLPAQQALLKVLEEPPKNTIIVIEAENQEQVLPTILSRAEVSFFPFQQQLSADLNKEITTFWADLFHNDSLGKRLLKSTAVSSKYTERGTMADWIDQQMIYFQKLLHKRVNQTTWNKNNLSPLKITQIIRLLLFSKKYLKAYVNVKLLLDNLFLNLPRLAS